MTDDDWGTAAFVHGEELGQWKLVKFSWDIVHAIRSDGTVRTFKAADDAERFIKTQAARLLVKYYLETTAKAA